MKKLTLLLLIFFMCCLAMARDDDNTKQLYQEAFAELEAMLNDEQPISFKRAVYLTENAYLGDNLDFEKFDKAIQFYVRLAKAVQESGGFLYTEEDRDEVLQVASIYRALKDTLTIGDPADPKSYIKYPLTYDMNDFWGEQNWTQMFVSKLLSTGSGNCHSLPALYKIVADELGVDAWLALAPNHTYIKHRNKKLGWYNTELTTGSFPFDPDIKWSSYIKTEAVAKGVYMDTISARQSIAYVMTDLAQGYNKKFGDHDLKTPIRWLETALKHYPNYINALILKTELEKRQFEYQMVLYGASSVEEIADKPDLAKDFEAIEKSYMDIHRLGYRKMPKEMYLNWLFKIKDDTCRQTHIFDKPQPFKDYDYDVIYATAGDGRNYEFFDTDTITRIGTVELNRLTGKIVRFVVYDPMTEMPDEVISRTYDPVIGRFMQVDPMADYREWVSPYNFVQNNPINRIDPTGMLDIYGLNKETGDISLLQETDDPTDELVDSSSGETISANVDKGLLSDGQNIKNNGLQTSNVKGGISLVRDISMHTSEEVGGTVYENSEGGRFLDVQPYAGQTLQTNSDGQVTGMSAGFSMEVKSSFTSNDGSFTGSPIAAFHTHPGHPNAAPSATWLGQPAPSGADMSIGVRNLTSNGVNIPYIIYGAKQMTYQGTTSNTATYRPRLAGSYSDGSPMISIPWKLRTRSWIKN